MARTTTQEKLKELQRRYQDLENTNARLIKDYDEVRMAYERVSMLHTEAIQQQHDNVIKHPRYYEIGYLTQESLDRLDWLSDKQTVPLHRKESRAAKIPVYVVGLYE